MPDSLLAIATLVARRAAEDVVFSAAAERVSADLGVEAGAVLRYLGDERAVVVGSWREGGPRGMPVHAELDFDADSSALGRARATRLAARADGYAADAGELSIVMQAAGLRASVAAPVLVDTRVWGAIVASSARAGAFPPGAEEALPAFAELIALAVAGAEADRRVAEIRMELLAAADQARSQLERDLHAGPQQHLAALAVKLRLAAAAAGAGSPAGALVEAAAAELVGAKASLEEIGRGLHPAVLTERGLAPAVLALTARARVTVSLRELPGRRFPGPVESTAYFVISEGLRNAADHAEATHVDVVVGDRGARLDVEVRDDGRGGADPEAGEGLRTLARRVAALGGRIEIESPAGGGTVLRAELPAAG
jgi:signal transduction histidine kinase